MSSVRKTTLAYRVCESGVGLEPIHNPTGQVVFVLPLSEGRLRVVRDGVVVFDDALPPGAVGVIQPGERASISISEPFEAVWLAVPASVHPLATELARDRPILGAREDVRELSPLLRSALRLEGAGRDVMANGLATALVGMLMRDAARNADSRGLTEDDYHRARAFAESRLTTGLDLTAWAAELGMAPSDFSRRFRNHTGKTPYAWFMDLRIEEAMRLLTTTTLRVVDIAFELGFSSQSHFSDVFRSRVGESPGRWRRGVSGR